MYKNGELDEIMTDFEKNLNKMPIYVGCKLERAEKIEMPTEDGRITKRYRNNNYYNNGNLNTLFLSYLWGYSAGKFAGQHNRE